MDAPMALPGRLSGSGARRVPERVSTRPPTPSLTTSTARCLAALSIADMAGSAMSMP